MMHPSERAAVRHELEVIGAAEMISQVMTFLRREGRPLSIAVRHDGDERWSYYVQPGGRVRLRAIVDRIAMSA